MPTTGLKLSLLILAVAPLAFAQTFRPIAAGEKSKLEKPSRVVLRNASELAAWWEKSFGNDKTPSHLNWGKEELVAIALGHRGSTGYTVFVTSADHDNGRVVVQWTERKPARGTRIFGRGLNPWCLVAIPITKEPVTFRGSFVDPGQPWATGDAYPRETFLTGGMSLLKEEGTWILNTPAEEAAFWVRAFGKASPPKPCDFVKYRLAVVALGRRPTSGYHIKLVRLARIGPHEVEVQYSETLPPGDRPVAQHVESPFVIYQLPMNGDTVTFAKVKDIG